MSEVGHIEDIITQIFDKLNVLDKFPLLSVCKTWFNLLNKSRFWEKLTSYENVQLFARYCTENSIKKIEWLIKHKIIGAHFADLVGIGNIIRTICICGYNDLFEYLLDKGYISMDEIIYEDYFIFRQWCLLGDLKIAKKVVENLI